MDQLLDLSRLDGDAVRIERSRVTVRDRVEALVDSIRDWPRLDRSLDWAETRSFMFGSNGPGRDCRASAPSGA
jgi:hypothetical protein